MPHVETTLFACPPNDVSFAHAALNDFLLRLSALPISQRLLPHTRLVRRPELSAEMDTLVAHFQPTSRRPDHDDELVDPTGWGSMGGFGNLSRGGGVKGMTIPRVPDVRSLPHVSILLLCRSDL